MKTYCGIRFLNLSARVVTEHAHLERDGRRNKSEQHSILLNSWGFSRQSAPIHWLVHGHMTSNNETVFRHMP